MVLRIGILVLLNLVRTVCAYPKAFNSDLHKPPSQDEDRAQEVRKVFQDSWGSYYEQAFPHDTLKPVSGKGVDDRGGWGVSMVDSLSTAIIMGEERIIHQMLEQIAKIDFTKTKSADAPISLFETTIRYLGGLLSGYDLLMDESMSHLCQNKTNVHMLLKQAQTLADGLSIAFETKSGIPDPTMFFSPEKRRSGAKDINLAEAGTLILEWTRLSDLSNNTKYHNLAQKAESQLLHPKGSIETWPGLVGNRINIEDGTFANSDGGWSGGTDSFYEYLIKMYQYDHVAYGEYKDRWISAANSTIAHLASHPSSRNDLTYLSQYSGEKIISKSSHLASFAGGNFILGGALLGEKQYEDFGLKLTESYFNNYNHTLTHIGPEQFAWTDPTSTGPELPDNQKAFYVKAGFFITEGSYLLRPETFESLYYAYRLTGNPWWQEKAWGAFRNIRSHCQARFGFAPINDVMKEDGGGPGDEMQSFWLAETLKYLYLIFGPESSVQLQLQGGLNSQFVFNTEAHPLKVRVQS